MQPGRLRYNSCPPGTPHPVILSEAQRAQSKDLGGESRISYLASRIWSGGRAPCSLFLAPGGSNFEFRISNFV